MSHLLKVLERESPGLLSFKAFGRELSLCFLKMLKVHLVHMHFDGLRDSSVDKLSEKEEVCGH